MRHREPIQFKADLLKGKEIIPVEATYDTKFSLLIQFLNGSKPSRKSDFTKLVFEKNGAQIEMGPCRFTAVSSKTGAHGRLIFYEDVYDFNSLFFENRLEKLQAEFQNVSLILAHKNKIKAKFKEYTANLTYDLTVYKNLFDKLDARMAGEPEEIQQHVQDAIIATEGRQFMIFLDKKLEEFEYLVANYNKKDHERHGFYFRKQLWSFILCSPFMARTNLKPRGYSGDSVMMNMIYANDYEGRSTFGKLMHKHPNEHPAAQAVRNRRDVIANILASYRAKDEKKNARHRKVLSVACGPAFELKNVLKTANDCATFHFTLLDQDTKALAEAKKLIAQLEKKYSAKIKVDYLNESVRTMLTTPALEKMWGKFDYIYSMGLFDYLTPPVAKAVLEKLYRILKVGGKMVIGNFHISNPSRFYMEYWLDWVLYYRSEQDLIDLLKSIPSAESDVFFEETGSQMFLRVKKAANR